MDTFKKSSINHSRNSLCSNTDSTASRRLLTKTCKMYLNKYEEIKKEIDAKAKKLQEMKYRKSKLDEKSRAISRDSEYKDYKAEMVTNKENIEEFLNVYKQHYSGQLRLLQEREDLESKLAQLCIEEKQTREKLDRTVGKLRECKETSKYALENKKYEEAIKEIRFRLVEQEIEINNYCTSKKIRNLRYYICQFGKQYALASLQDVTICQLGKVDALQAFLKSNPIYVSVKKQISQFISLYRRLEETLMKKPQSSQKLESLKSQQTQLSERLKQIQGSIVATKALLQRNTEQIQQETNRQIKVNLKAALEQNLGDIGRQAKFIAIQQRKRIKSVKEKIHEVRYISGCLKNIKSVENSRKDLLDRKQTLDRVIDEEEYILRNKLNTKEELEECLDNIISDRHAFSIEDRAKRTVSVNEQQPIKSQITFPPEKLQVAKCIPLSRSGSASQSTTILNSYTSRQSRLVSLSETERRLPITHSMNKKSVEDIIMSRITRRSIK